MARLAWTPWHQVVRLRDDIRSGELTLAIFAADLYDAQMKRGPKVYQDPKEFFALTYPTYNLRELAKDVVLRLARKNDKAIRQLELTYGGGKTHTLITLLHLVTDPDGLPDLPAVHEFTTHIGMKPPKARVAILAFDKLDAEKGMEVADPEGKLRWLRAPWSVLAWQLAGAEGLKLLHPDNKAEERESAPAEPLLKDLLLIPGKSGLATLILVDEVLMYAREKVGLDPVWKDRLVNFFQYLTQAVVKVDTCAMVASLLASDPGKNDGLGKEITKNLFDIFRRQRDEGVQPVVKEDVAEVLRRRFFTPESTRSPEAFRQHVVAALKGVYDADEQSKKDGKAVEERFLKSYPFHPDLTDVLYSKWTQLEGFQRTRGVLRTFALALRDSEKWDESPLVGPNCFLCEPKKNEISEAARELTTIATTEEYEGKRQEWSAILFGELEKAREIQKEFPGLRHREVEQAVFATFVHSQPIGQKALTRDLQLVLSPTRPDRIELEKALIKWTEVSWFLDEAAISEADPANGGKKSLPKAWRLGSKPNLRQMHHDAKSRVNAELIEEQLLSQIEKLRVLTQGASAAGARVHNLPIKPNDIEDDGEFHFAVLGPKASSDSGKPSAEARRFLDETTASDRPRVYRNAVVLAVPSKDGLEAARTRILDYMAWEDVRSQLKDQIKEGLDPIRSATLNASLEGARRAVPEAIRQAYTVAVTVSEKNEVHAFKLSGGDDADPLFIRIKNDRRSRIQDSAISPEALLPSGPYNLWREGETARFVKDLVSAFAQHPHLPKMLKRSEIVQTLIAGARDGIFVLKSRRPDGTFRTLWRQEPSDADLKEASLELVLPEAAALSEISPDLLVPGRLPGLWPTSGEITFRALCDFFSGANTIRVQREGYEEAVTIPKAGMDVLRAAVEAAVERGKLWLLTGVASIHSESIPSGLLTESTLLLPPPRGIPPTDLQPSNLPEGWKDNATTGVSLATALSARVGKVLPWSVIRESIDGALRARMLQKAVDCGPWPCDFPGAAAAKFNLPSTIPAPHVPPPSPPPTGNRVAEAELKPNELQDLADAIGEIRAAAVGTEIKLVVRIELPEDASQEIVNGVNRVLSGVKKGFGLK